MRGFSVWAWLVIQVMTLQKHRHKATVNLARGQGVDAGSNACRTVFSNF